MKRQPLIFALALLLVVGAALWGVNYRLDYPPLTNADKEFRAFVAGADSVEITSMTCTRNACSPSAPSSQPQILNAQQTRELIQTVHFIDSAKNEAHLWNEPVKRSYMLEWKSGPKHVLSGEIRQTKNFTATDCVGFRQFQPRSQKQFWRIVDRAINP